MDEKAAEIYVVQGLAKLIRYYADFLLVGAMTPTSKAKAMPELIEFDKENQKYLTEKKPEKPRPAYLVSTDDEVHIWLAVYAYNGIPKKHPFKQKIEKEYHDTNFSKMFEELMIFQPMLV